MKKVYLFIVLIILVIVSVVLYFVLNNNETNNFTLIIKQSSWSGWSEDYVPEEITKEYKVELNKEYVIDSYFIFTIKKINSNSIVIKSNYPLSDNQDGTINLSSNKTEFTVNLDKELMLITPSMDAGDIYYLTLKK